MVKNLPAKTGNVGSILGGIDPLEKELATCSSVLAWEIPWTGGPGGLQSMGLQSWARLSTHSTAARQAGGSEVTEADGTPIISVLESVSTGLTGIWKAF